MPPKEKAKAKAKAAKEDAVVGPVQPDEEKYKEKIDALTTEITKIQGELESLKTHMNAGEREEYDEQKAAFAAEINTYADRVAKLNEHKKVLRDGLNEKGKEKRAAFSELKKTESMFQCKTENEVVERIQQIEWKLSTESLSLLEEKRLIQDIQTLKKQKPHISAAAAKIDHLKSVTQGLATDQNASVNSQIDTLTKQATEAWQAMEEVKKKRNAATEAWMEKHKDTAEMKKKRDDLRAKMHGMVREKTELRDQLRKAKAEWDRFEQEQRQIKQEKRDAERNAQREQWEKTKYERELEKLTTEKPHLAEITALEQSICFLKSLMPKEEIEVKQISAQEFNNPEGSMVLVNKKDRDEECFYVNPKKKGIHKKNKTNKSAVIKHNAETFILFEALKIKAPSSIDQVPDTLKELEAQLVHYNGLVAEWQRKLDDGTLLKDFQEQRPAAADAVKQ